MGRQGFKRNGKMPPAKAFKVPLQMGYKQSRVRVFLHDTHDAIFGLGFALQCAPPFRENTDVVAITQKFNRAAYPICVVFAFANVCRIAAQQVRKRLNIPAMIDFRDCHKL